MSWGVGADQLSDQRHHAGDDFVFAEAAIGEEGVVGDIDISCSGEGADDLPQHGEAAEAGIEDKNGWSVRHARILETVGYRGVFTDCVDLSIWGQ